MFLGKAKRFATIGCIAMQCLFCNAQSEDIHLNNIIQALESINNYQAEAQTNVSMPQMSDDVVYMLGLMQQKCNDDALLTMPYIIDWHLRSSRAPKHGFSAYFNGNHFRFSGARIQEFHLPADSLAFTLSGFGTKSKGVHRSVQFFNLLPQSIALNLRALAQDSLSRIRVVADTIVGGNHYIGVTAKTVVNGSVGSVSEYLFNPLTKMPERIRTENNPGSVSEQSIAVDFLSTSTAPLPRIDQQRLIELYPNEFANYRKSNFTITSLRGARLPSFSLPTSTAERFTYNQGDNFRRPTIIVMLEAYDGKSPDVRDQIHEAMAESGCAADVIWAFTDTSVDAVESVVERPQPGEHVLINAASLIKKCGASTLPAIIVADREGIVRNIFTGHNNDTGSDVIKAVTLIE